MNDKTYSKKTEEYNADKVKPIKEERQEEQNWRIIEIKGTYFEPDSGRL